MKAHTVLILLALAGTPAFAQHEHPEHGHGEHASEGPGHGGHDHGEPAAKAGPKAPNGGRMILAVEPHAEVFITPERKVQITFVADEGNVVPPAEQAVTLITGERNKPTRLAFTKQGNVLISEGTIPEGNDFPTVVQIKPTPDSKTITDRFYMNLSACPTCEFAEYACKCHD